jgi:hypothetical protein
MIIRLANCFFFIVMIVMNYLANALPLNGRTTGALSEQYPNLFVPAGITFSIWGIIYLLLLVFCVVQFIPKYENAVKRISPFVIFNFILNAIWIFAWHYEYVLLSVLVMVGLLYSLIQISRVLSQYSFELAKITFGIYMGWICIATIANVTTLLVHIQWSAFGVLHEYWAISMIVIGAFITAFGMVKINPYLGLSVCWAFIGIFIKRQFDYPLIAYFAIGGLLALGFLFIALKFKMLRLKV